MALASASRRSGTVDEYQVPARTCPLKISKYFYHLRVSKAQLPDDFLIVTADSSYHHLRANIVHRANGAEFWHSRPGSNIEDLVLALIGAAYTASDSGGGFG